MANEQEWIQNDNLCFWLRVVVSKCITNGGAGVRFVEITPRRVRAPFIICSPPCTVCIYRVTFLGIGTQSEWYISFKIQYSFETDSTQVPWGKNEKDFEKRVKSTWNRWRGSEWDQYSLARLLHLFIQQHFHSDCAVLLKWMQRRSTCLSTLIWRCAQPTVQGKQPVGRWVYWAVLIDGLSNKCFAVIVSIGCAALGIKLLLADAMQHWKHLTDDEMVSFDPSWNTDQGV